MYIHVHVYGKLLIDILFTYIEYWELVDKSILITRKVRKHMLRVKLHIGMVCERASTLLLMLLFTWHRKQQKHGFFWSLHLLSLPTTPLLLLLWSRALQLLSRRFQSFHLLTQEKDHKRHDTLGYFLFKSFLLLYH